MMYTLDETIQLYKDEAAKQKDTDVAEMDKQVAIWLTERKEYKNRCKELEAKLKSANDTNRDNVESITKLYNKLKNEKRITDMQRGELAFASQIIGALINKIGGEKENADY